MGIDWKRKLISRKFWAAIAEFVTMLILAFGGQQEVAVQVTALIMAGAAVVAYIIGEGLVDKAFNDNVITLPYDPNIEEQEPPQE